jgi:hypothetical protein
VKIAARKEPADGKMAETGGRYIYFRLIIFIISESAYFGSSVSGKEEKPQNQLPYCP